jgi:DNA invertase Pin-like site-specific DNA recombinase
VAIVGYARTSTGKQEAGLEVQVTLLNEVGCERIFDEQASAVGKRERLELMLDWVRDGDTVIVTKLDRLARSMFHFCDILQTLQKKQVNLRILDFGLDTSAPIGKLMVNMCMAIAEFEREIMLERQRDGIAKAKREGRYTGRKPTARAKSAEIVRLAQQGFGRGEIANHCEVGIASVYRILAEARR